MLLLYLVSCLVIHVWTPYQPTTQNSALLRWSPSCSVWPVRISFPHCFLSVGKVTLMRKNLFLWTIRLKSLCLWLNFYVCFEIQSRSCQCLWWWMLLIAQHGSGWCWWQLSIRKCFGRPVWQRKSCMIVAVMPNTCARQVSQQRNFWEQDTHMRNFRLLGSRWVWYGMIRIVQWYTHLDRSGICYNRTQSAEFCLGICRVAGWKWDTATPRVFLCEAENSWGRIGSQESGVWFDDVWWFWRSNHLLNDLNVVFEGQ